MLANFFYLKDNTMNREKQGLVVWRVTNLEIVGFKL